MLSGTEIAKAIVVSSVGVVTVIGAVAGGLKLVLSVDEMQGQPSPLVAEIVRIEPVKIQYGGGKRTRRWLKSYSVQIKISDPNNARAICAFAPRVIDSILEQSRRTSDPKRLSGSARATLHAAAGKKAIKAVNVVEGKKSGGLIHFAKPAEPSVVCAGNERVRNYATSRK